MSYKKGKREKTNKFCRKCSHSEFNYGHVLDSLGRNLYPKYCKKCHTFNDYAPEREALGRTESSYGNAFKHKKALKTKQEKKDFCVSDYVNQASFDFIQADPLEEHKTRLKLV